jgi:hypothetical protein
MLQGTIDIVPRYQLMEGKLAAKLPHAGNEGLATTFSTAPSPTALHPTSRKNGVFLLLHLVESAPGLVVLRCS